MDSEKLKFFIDAAQTLNFSEVARRNFISQPTISHQIDLLERELGIKLFFRNGKKLSLTSDGERFLPLATRLLDEIEATIAEIRQSSSAYRQQLDVLLPETGQRVFNECLKAFYAKHPDIVVNNYRLPSPSWRDAIDKGSYDVYFILEKNITANSAYEYINAMSDSLALVMPLNGPVINDTGDLSALRNIPYIGFNNNYSDTLRNDINSIFERRGFKPKIANTYNMLNDVMVSVELGNGYSILPYSLVRDRKSVVSLPFDDEACKTKCVIAWEKRNTNPALKLFKDVVRELYPQE